MWGCHKPSICENAASSKCNKKRSACINKRYGAIYQFISKTIFEVFRGLLPISSTESMDILYLVRKFVAISVTTLAAYRVEWEREAEHCPLISLLLTKNTPKAIAVHIF